MTPPKQCEFCHKRGLPLLLVRDALVPAGAGAPLASGLSIELPPKTAHYTKRLLRSGYLNVFDEARKRWETYFVTLDGYFFKLLQTPGLAPAIPSKPFNCPDTSHRAVASCITVSDPTNASTVWIGFSDVLWTDAVRKAHEDRPCRQRHMVEIDVQAVLKGQSARYRPIAGVAGMVAEYAMVPAQANTAFVHSPFQYETRHGQAERLIHACDAMRPGKGVIVTVPDPAGIAQELACLMKGMVESFIAKNPGDQRRLAASVAIDQIKEAVCKQAELGEIAAADHLADQQVAANPIGHGLFKSIRAQTEDIRKITPTQLERVRKNAWEKYNEKFEDEERQAWLGPFNQNFKAFDAEHIAPLALAHVAWMKSRALIEYFESNFDRSHMEAGLVYTAVVTRCLTATQDKQCCAKLYEEWLDGDISDTKNLLLRAMVFNQSVVAKSINEATTASINWRQISWDSLFAVYTNSVERYTQDAADTAARLIAQLGGPLARMFDKVLEGNVKIRAAVMATGLISGHPVVVLEITGSKRQFQSYVVKELIRISGQPLGEKKMKKAVAAELRRLEIKGVSLEGTTKRRWALLADKDAIARIASNLSEEQHVAQLVQSTRTVEAIDALNLGRWRSVINQNLGCGIVAGILQTVSLTKLIADEKKSLANEKLDATSRRYAGVAALAGTLSEVVGNALAARAELGMRFGQGVALNTASFLRISGRAGGIFAGILVAGLDALKIREAMSESQPGLAWLYGASAIVGIGLTAALVNLAASAAFLGVATIPVIGILVILLIGIGICIEFVKDNPVQDWLERCPWGKLSAQRYPNMVIEQTQLKQALN
ncbi:T6SS effector BTH_I2691 family protein [Massilia niastensis]|uniref:T6SS effector BTH_I2691 family protein n=1 Tax=Massilia niastensis TaxID=544911 RepID=UPI0003A5AFEC|nr:T6SS effector BTH_I2691 family protein [Massilia niastensis]